MTRGTIVSLGGRHEAMERIAAVLARDGLLEALHVPLDLSALHRALTRTPLSGDRLAKWAYTAPARSVAVTSELRCIAAYRLPGAGDVDELRRRREFAVDRAVARTIAADPPQAFIGRQHAALRSLRAARRAGIPGIVFATGDIWGVNAGLRAAAERASGPVEAAGARAELNVAAEKEATAELVAATHVLVESPRMAARVTSFGFAPDAVTVVGNGVDEDRFRPGRSAADDGVLRAVFVGRAGWAKGVPDAAEAARLAGPGVRLTVVGPGRDLDHWRARWPDVTFTGAVPAEAVQKRLADADVFVLPTLSDSMPRAVLEALAAGLPLVITREAGFAHVIEDGVHGFQVAAGDASGIAEALARLAADGALRARMGVAARALAEAWSWEAFERRIEAELDGSLRFLREGRS